MLRDRVSLVLAGVFTLFVAASLSVQLMWASIKPTADELPSNGFSLESTEPEEDTDMYRGPPPTYGVLIEATVPDPPPLIRIETQKESILGLERGKDPFDSIRGIPAPDLSELWETFHRERLSEEGEWENGKLGGRKMAYAFYVTSAQYACGARVVMRQLRDHGAKAGFLVVYKEQSITEAVIRGLQEDGAVTRAVKALPFISRSYYRDALVKLRIFQQFDYDRLIFMDADTYANANLDHLFSVQLRGPELIAAPWRYYNAPTYTRFMPWLMVVEPREEIWSELERRFLNQRAVNELQEILPSVFDGEILNLAFMGERSLKIPPQYAIINTEWCKDPRRPTSDLHQYFTSRRATPLDQGIVHFSCWGKPWMHSWEDIDARMIVEPLYSKYREWYDIASEIGCH